MSSSVLIYALTSPIFVLRVNCGHNGSIGASAVRNISLKIPLAIPVVMAVPISPCSIPKALLTRFEHAERWATSFRRSDVVMRAGYWSRSSSVLGPFATRWQKHSARLPFGHRAACSGGTPEETKAATAAGKEPVAPVSGASTRIRIPRNRPAPESSRQTAKPAMFRFQPAAYRK